VQSDGASAPPRTRHPSSVCVDCHDGPRMKHQYTKLGQELDAHTRRLGHTRLFDLSLWTKLRPQANMSPHRWNQYSHCEIEVRFGCLGKSKPRVKEHLKLKAGQLLSCETQVALVQGGHAAHAPICFHHARTASFHMRRAWANNNFRQKHAQCSDIMQASHACDPGSSPDMRAC